MNIVVVLERRQWLPVEQRSESLLQRLCEDFAIQRMTSNKIQTTLSAPVSELNSTMAVAFSCDGKYFASGHLTHNIIVGLMTPYIQFWKLLSGHDRTPWVLTFDLIQPHILYSGCLAGKVCKWSVQDEGRCLCSYSLSLSSPVNSISPLPSHPDLLLVAMQCFLCLLSTADLSEVWRVKTESEKHILRLVVPHPLESKILTAITNVNSPLESLPSTFKVQLHPFHKDYPPELKHAQNSGGSTSPNEVDRELRQLICPRARIFSPHSLILTATYCICIVYDSMMNGNHSVCVYSALSSSCGECLYTLPLGRNNLVSVALSPHSEYLLLGFAAQRSTYHYETRGSCDIEIYRFQSGVTGRTSNSRSVHMKKMGSIPSLGSNVAMWVPLNAGHGYGVCFGSARHGAVFFWRVTEPTDKKT